MPWTIGGSRSASIPRAPPALGNHEPVNRDLSGGGRFGQAGPAGPPGTGRERKKERGDMRRRAAEDAHRIGTADGHGR